MQREAVSHYFKKIFPKDFQLYIKVYGENQKTSSNKRNYENAKWFKTKSFKITVKESCSYAPSLDCVQVGLCMCQQAPSLLPLERLRSHVLAAVERKERQQQASRHIWS